MKPYVSRQMRECQEELLVLLGGVLQQSSPHNLAEVVGHIVISKMGEC